MNGQVAITVIKQDHKEETMGLRFLASFSNSRVFPRPATSDATTGSGSVESGAVVKAIEQNENMTYATFRNISETQPIYYVYRFTEEEVPTAEEIIEEGMVLEAGDSYDIEAKKDLYITTVGGDSAPYRLDIGEG
jgi:hypothetical protein